MKCYGACYGELASRNMLRNISIYGAAVQRDEAKRNRAAAWLDAAVFPSPTPEAQPYSEMERSRIELLHGWTQPFSRSLLLLCSRILTYDRLSHLHPVHRS